MSMANLPLSHGFVPPLYPYLGFVSWSDIITGAIVSQNPPSATYLSLFVGIPQNSPSKVTGQPVHPLL